jgi:hypothetical protein
MRNTRSPVRRHIADTAREHDLPIETRGTDRRLDVMSFHMQALPDRRTLPMETRPTARYWS